MTQFTFTFIMTLLMLQLEASNELPVYKHKQQNPWSSYEAFTIEHAQRSFENSLARESKLTDKPLSYKPLPLHHLLNNLSTIKGINILQIGCESGKMIHSSSYNNEFLIAKYLILDTAGEQNRNNIQANLLAKLPKMLSYEIVKNTNYSSLKKNKIPYPIDLFYYKGEPNVDSISRAFSQFNEYFADIFYVVVDDWGWEVVRSGTFGAFDNLSYTILYENTIPTGQDIGNGQYLAVIKKA